MLPSNQRDFSRLLEPGKALATFPDEGYGSTGFHLEDRDDDDEDGAGRAVLTLTILVALAVIILALTLVVALAWQRHTGSARLEHPAATPQQTDPISGR
jgi:hypothetical protein